MSRLSRLLKPSRSTRARRAGSDIPHRDGRNTPFRAAVMPTGRARRARPAVKQAGAARQAPPVLSRHPANAVPLQIRKRSSGRRRFDVALSVPGAELRLPYIPQFRLGWRLLSALLSLGLGGLLYFLWTAPMFQITEIEVVGQQRVSAGEISLVAGLSGDPVFTVSPDEVRDDLQKAFPEMAAITVEVGLPAMVVIHVDERQPVLIWREDNEEMWVDAGGFMFPPRGDPGALPVLHGDLPFTVEASLPGFAPARSIDPQLVTDVLELKSQAPQDSAVYYEADYGLGWRDRHGWEVYFGMSNVGGSMAEKLNVYTTLVERLQQENITPVFISVEYVNAPYFRLER